MKVYFAHPISDYGTAREERCLAHLAREGYEVVNPNSPVHEAGYAFGGMSYFTELAGECDGLVYQTFPCCHYVGAGVGREILEVMLLGKPVKRINAPYGEPVTIVDQPANLMPLVFTIEETRMLVADARNRSFVPSSFNVRIGGRRFACATEEEAHQVIGVAPFGTGYEVTDAAGDLVPSFIPY